MGVIWVEIPVVDLDRAQAFCADDLQVNLERRVLGEPLIRYATWFL